MAARDSSTGGEIAWFPYEEDEREPGKFGYYEDEADDEYEHVHERPHLPPFSLASIPASVESTATYSSPSKPSTKVTTTSKPTAKVTTTQNSTTNAATTPEPTTNASITLKPVTKATKEAPKPSSNATQPAIPKPTYPQASAAANSGSVAIIGALIAFASYFTVSL
ncbi:hypothetical protein B0O99DRAFT_624405 [Bisporella sp. PMI_857]|nr:hypothetical protein B0O99DRAFT_624405 [Bisporella sp. PMI_857]